MCCTYEKKKLTSTHPPSLRQYAHGAAHTKHSHQPPPLYDNVHTVLHTSKHSHQPPPPLDDDMHTADSGPARCVLLGRGVERSVCRTPVPRSLSLSLSLPLTVYRSIPLVLNPLSFALFLSLSPTCIGRSHSCNKQCISWNMCMWCDAEWQH